MIRRIVYLIPLFLFALLSLSGRAQSSKSLVYGEIGLGVGKTLFFGQTQAKLGSALGGSFSPGVGNNLMMGFYVAPERWKGLGLGTRLKGTFGASSQGDNGDDYIFNYYTVALTAKYYPFSRQFNRGFYGRGSVGFGQFTTKRVQEPSKLYVHQYGIGSSFLLGTGYSWPLRRGALSLEAEFEYSSRNGTVNNEGDVRFTSGQLGLNLLYSF